MKKSLIIVLVFFCAPVQCMQRLRPLIMARKQPQRNYGREVILYQITNRTWQETLRLKQATEKKTNIPQLPKPKFKYCTELEKQVRVKKPILKQKRREIHINDLQEDSINHFCNCFAECNPFGNSCFCLEFTNDLER